MKTILLIASVCLLLVTPPLLGDYYDPPAGWSDNPYFTHQQWEFSTGDNPSDPEQPYINPNGLPSAEVGGQAIWIYDPTAYVPMDRRGMWVVGGLDNPSHAGLTLEIPNVEAMPEKLVWLQLTYFLAGAPGAVYDTDLVTGGGEQVIVVPGSEIAYEVPGEAGWFYYETMWQILPQPSHETVIATIDLPAGAVFALDEAVVDTICIPEPATLSLLGLGGLALLRRRSATQ